MYNVINICLFASMHLITDTWHRSRYCRFGAFRVGRSYRTVFQSVIDPLISLSINFIFNSFFTYRWGKIRMLLPYQPDYKQDQLKVPGTGVCASGNCNGQQHSHQVTPMTVNKKCFSLCISHSSLINYFAFQLTQIRIEKFN
jgi:Domain of unknown function (DUF4808)